MLALPEKAEPLPEKPPAEEKRRTVTLTNARPLSILESEWPVVAEGSYHDEHESGVEVLKVDFRVREKAYGRHLIHGKFSYYLEDEHNETIRVGRLLGYNSHSEVETALREVGEEMIERLHTPSMKKWVILALDACFEKLGPQIV